MPHRACTLCTAPAKDCCTACSIAPTLMGHDYKRAFYCSTSCQKLDWPRHKLDCKNTKVLVDRQSLDKAAQFLQSSFIAWREAAFDISVKSLEVKDDVLIVQENQYADAQEIFHDFPSHLFQGKDPYIGHALLTMMCCTDIFFVNQKIAAMLLEDSKLAKKIEEITFKPNLTGLRRWKLIRPHTTFTSDTYNHSAYRVTLKSGDQFAIDLTAAQYGLKHSYCVPWQEYQQKRIQRVEELTPFGAQAAKFADGKNRSHYGDPLTEQILLAGYKVSDAIEAGIVREFEALEMTACKLLVSTSEDAFMDASMSMIDCGLQEAAAAKKKFGRANCFKVRVG